MDIKIGQIWESKGTTFPKICILAINRVEEKVFVCGVVDEVDPEFSFQYLEEAYQLVLEYENLREVNTVIPAYSRPG